MRTISDLLARGGAARSDSLGPLRRIFDAAWYLERNPDVRSARVPAFAHYVDIGWKERRSPSPFFSSAMYLAVYKDVRDLGVEPFMHFYTTGAREGRWANPIFFTSWYLDTHPDARRSAENPLFHYIASGAKQRLRTSPFFDPEWFMRSSGLPHETPHLALMRAFLGARGKAAGQPCEYFDTDYYLRNYEDVVMSGLHPIAHYFFHGASEGRCPSDRFDTKWYVAENADVKAGSMNPLAHFLEIGRFENRRPSAPPSAVSIRSNLEDRLRLQLSTFLQSGQELEFPDLHGKPEVSVVVVLYNKAHFTLTCLLSLHQLCLLSKHSIEVVVFDNRSSDETGEVLSRLRNATLIDSDENIGYVRAANVAAGHATGRFVLLLNNDTDLTPGAIDSAVETMASDPSVGAVGGRLVLPDGTLQEAGCIVWNDGSTTGFGRGLSPEHPSVMFRREVDYCSGAFLMLRTKVFRELGGYDETYAPAYYEDADLCARLSDIGLKVVYDPGVLVFHFEWGSADSKTSVVRQILRNQALFVRRHPQRMATSYPPMPENPWRAADVRRDAKRVLFVADRIPHARFGQGAPRARGLMLDIAAYFDNQAIITLACTDEDDFAWSDVRQTLPITIEVASVKAPGALPNLLRERADVLDLIVVSGPQNAERITAAMIGLPRKIPLIYDSDAILSKGQHLLSALRGAAPTDEQRDADICKEVELAGNADLVFAVTETEAQAFRTHVGADVVVLGHSISIKRDVAPFSARNGILFVGTIPSHDSPNGESMLWFVREIWPRIQALKASPVPMYIVGRNDSSVLSGLCREDITIVGHVEDLQSYYDRCRVFVAPTRAATGLPYKVHEAVGRGIPAVVTDLVVEQLGWQSGAEVLVASEAETFASACVRLHDDPALWDSLVRKGQLAVDRDCNPDAFRGVLNAAMDRLRVAADAQHHASAEPEGGDPLRR